MEVLAISPHPRPPRRDADVPDWTDVPGGTFGGSAVTSTLRTLQDLLVIKARVVRGAYRRLRVVDPYPATPPRPDLTTAAARTLGRAG